MSYTKTPAEYFRIVLYNCVVVILHHLKGPNKLHCSQNLANEAEFETHALTYTPTAVLLPTVATLSQKWQ